MIRRPENPLRARWSEGAAAIGVTVPIAAPELIEICGLLGFDFALIDAEHGPLDRRACADLVRAAQAAGITPLVRVLRSDPAEILQALDTGAVGVMVPGIETAEEARAAVRASRFAPDGERGLAATRAAAWGIFEPLAAYTRRANAEVAVIGLVESVQGMKNLAEIAAVPGIDAVFLGPSDLSQSMGFPGESGHPAVQQTLEKGLSAIRQAGKIAGISAATGAAARTWQETHGVRLIAVGLSGLLIAGARSFLTEARVTRRPGSAKEALT